ncbi:cytochrome P450 [Streptomyces sp. NPDC091217]|uniref:cytochrome P450 n=1 Tax=Streptomyces sp. NPDC091217 TaxID=3365975 RepID=UPI0037F20E7C
MTATHGIRVPPAVHGELESADLVADPYPGYAELRRKGSVLWFEAIRRYLVIGFEACRQVEMDDVTFSSDDPASLQRRAMGHSMIRKDGHQHTVERRGFGNVLKPKEIMRTWRAVFAETTAAAVRRYRALGPGADFHTEFAAPLAGENLRRIIGFANATSEDLRRWSQDLIDGAGNYADDPDVWARAARSNAEIDAAIAELRPRLTAEPDASLLAQVLSTGQSTESVCANVKLAVSGGLNEPRDLMGTIVWALVERPEQLALVLDGKASWSTVFDEAVRWVSPLGMYVRRTTTDTELDGFALPSGAQLAIVVAAANRDPAQFEDPDQFDVRRDKRPHLAFGNGPHFCAGSWVARSMVADFAMPAVFAALHDLRLDPANPPAAAGWVFRGPTSLPLHWAA